MTEDNTPYLLHEDKTWTNLCMLFHTVETLTLSQGITLEHRQALKKAIPQVVKANPILMGHAAFENDRFYLVPNAFPVNKHSFYEEIDLSDQVPQSFQFSDENQHENFQFMEKIILPHCKRGKSKSEVKNKSPLFSFTVFILTENIICYKMDMSHIIGDASTYYALMDQINSTFANEPINPINWDNPLARSSGIFPDRCSERDKYRMMGFPLFISVLRNLPKSPFRRHKHFLIDQEIAEEKKLSLVDTSKHKFLSTNDIIMAALCQMNPNAKLMSMAMNRRGRSNDIDSRDGGNFICIAGLDGDAGRDPNTIRHIVKRGQFFEPNQVPLKPYLEGKICSVTNWTSLTTFLNAHSVRTLSHMPVPVKSPADTCVIFKATESCTAISCNFPVRNTFGEDLSLEDIFIPENNQGTNDSTFGKTFGRAASMVTFVAVIIGLVIGDAFGVGVVVLMTWLLL